MNNQLNEEQAERLEELAQAADALQDAIDRIYATGYHKKLHRQVITNKRNLEDTLGRLYAVAGKMAQVQDLSWTNVCECACREEKEE